FGAVTNVTDPLGHVTKQIYDADGRVITAQDANQSGSACTGSPAPCTQYVFDVAGELTSTIRADATTLVNDYNSDGTVLDQKDGKLNAIRTYGYDALARVTSVKDALNNETDTTYDAAGNRLSTQTPGGNCS